MTYIATTRFTVKTKVGDLTLNPGQVITLVAEKAKKLIAEGKLRPMSEDLPSGEDLSERMAIMGENTEPEQTQPYVTDSGVLVIPFNSPEKYHYWKPVGQGVCDILRGIGRCDLIPKYKSIYSN